MSDPKDLLELQFEVQKYWASSLIVPTSQACVSIKSLLLFFSPEQAGFSALVLYAAQKYKTQNRQLAFYWCFV